jgi:WD40 repeat protein
MLKEYILTDISIREITYEPGGEPVSFDVTVVNNSEQFATFQVELLAAVTTSSNINWYTISPEVCTKKPPGDVTHFFISIIDSPKPGFTGSIKLTVRVFSLELSSAESRQIIRLVIPGNGVAPPQIDLLNSEFDRYPGEKFKIPVSIESLSQRASNATISLSGIDAAWFPNGVEQRLILPPHEKIKTVFDCFIPNTLASASGIYNFTINVQQQEAPAATVQGQLRILPQGFILFKCLNNELTIPNISGSSEKKQKDLAQYTLIFDNQSNLCQEVSVQIIDIDNRRKRNFKFPAWLQRYQGQKTELATQETPSLQPQISSQFEIIPEKANLNLIGETLFNLTVKHPRHWLGWQKRKLFQVQAVAKDSRVEVNNDHQTLVLKILPVIPVGIQVSSLVITSLLSLGIGHSLLRLQRQHQGAVNSVHFNGVAGEAISGASDQTIRKWKVSGSELEPLSVLASVDKAVRVVRYRPVNNDRIAVGYENGQIQLIDLLSGTAEPPFTANLDDRVFDLTFTKDSRALFSGHGSGQVIKWDLNKGITKNSSILSKQQVGFAVNALALLGESDSHLAIAGRFNQLTLWDLKTDKLRQVIANGSDKDYILSLAAPDNKPNILITGDNQGKIKVWNMRSCLTSKDDCEIVDQWNADAQSVRTLAISNDGCFLASAGEEGKAKLWSLNARGERSSQNLGGQIIDTSNKAFGSIDIVRTSDALLVATGGEDKQVKLHRISKTNFDCR